MRKFTMTLFGVLCSTVIFTSFLTPTGGQSMKTSEDKDVPRMKLRRKNSEYLQPDATLIDSKSEKRFQYS